MNGWLPNKRDLSVKSMNEWRRIKRVRLEKAYSEISFSVFRVTTYLFKNEMEERQIENEAEAKTLEKRALKQTLETRAITETLETKALIKTLETRPNLVFGGICTP